MADRKSLVPQELTRTIERVPDLTLFLCVSIGGMVTLVLLRLAHVPILIAIGWAITLISVYGFTSVHTKRYRMPSDRAADNCYYLGLLFTLTAIGFSLWAVISYNRDTEVIVSDLGLSLGSTIAGLLWRLSLSSMREDPLEVEESIRHELSESARTVRGQLQAVVEEFEMFVRSIHEVAEDSASQIAPRIDSVLEDFAKALSEASHSTKQEMTDGTKRQLMVLDGAVDSFCDSITRYGESIETVNSKTEEFKKNFEELKISDDFVEAAFEPIIATIKEASDAISSTDLKQKEALTDLTQNLQSLTGAGKELSAVFGEAKSVLEGLNAQRGNFENTATEILSKENELTSLLVDRIGKLKSSHDINESVLREISESQVEFSENTRLLADAMSDMAQAIELSLDSTPQ